MTASPVPPCCCWLSAHGMQSQKSTPKAITTRRRKAIDWVENTVKAEGIECKFERIDGYLFPYMEIESDYKKLEQEIGSAHKVGCPFCVLACE